MKQFFLFILSISLTTLSALAVEPSPTVAAEIVVTASALPERVDDVPASVTIVTREEMDERGARDVADLLREVPGVAISRTGSPGRATSMFTRGSNSNHTLVLWNGIEITNPYFSGYDWGRFSTVGVEQIEVVRGPYSALYGSDAVAGVVNVLTTPHRTGVRAQLEAGGNGLRNGSVNGAWMGERMNLAASFESREDDGFAPNDDFAQDSFSAALRWNLTDSTHAGISARYTTYENGVPMNLNFAGDALVPSLNRRQDGIERQLALPIVQQFGTRASFELTLAESRREDDFADPDDPYGMVSSSTESETRRGRLVARAETSFGTIVAGGEYERAEVDDVTNWGPNFTGGERTERSLFIEDRLTRDLGGRNALEVSAGARWDDYESFGSEISPRLAVAWIHGENKVHAAWGEAFRAPAVGELYFPFMGNPDLEAESSRSIEFGYHHASGVSATLFRSDYDDLIVFGLATYRFENVGAANAQGIELAFERHLTRALRIATNYTFTDTEEEGEDRSLVRRPRHAGSLSLAHHAGSLSSSAVITYTGDRADVMPVAPFARTTNDAHTLLDVAVHYELGRLTPFVKIENATDVAYEEVLGYPSASRRFVAGVRFGM